VVMQELTLTRVFGDRRLYAFEGVGSIRLTGLGKRGGLAEAGGQRWQITALSFWKRDIRATDTAGIVVGEFAGRALAGGGELRWYGRDYVLRRHTIWRERCGLSDGARELATIDGKSWGAHPVTIRGDDLSVIDPGLLLFAAFVVRALAVAAAEAAAG
jgi:hypothetical protein